MGLRQRLLAAIDRDPIILSHHPLCGKFDDHMFKVRGRFVCIGCSTVYPSALVAVVMLWLLDPGSFGVTAAIALTLFAVNLLRFLVDGRRTRIVFNVLLGASLGTVVFAAFYAEGWLRIVFAVSVIAVAMAFSVVKGRRVFATCKKCESYPKFPACGFPKQEAQAQAIPEDPSFTRT